MITKNGFHYWAFSTFLLSITVLSIIFLNLINKRKSISKNLKNLPPSPPKLPFIGNLHQFGSLVHQSFYLLSLKYGPLMILQLGEVPWLIVSSSDMACAIMRTHDSIFASRPSIVVTDIIRFKDVAFEPYGEDWRQLKRIFTTHLMSNKMVGSYKTVREGEINTLVRKISNHASLSNGGPIELTSLFFSFMTCLICRIVCGKFVLEEGRYHAFREMVEETFSLASRFSIGDLFPSMPWMDALIGLSRRANKNREKWDRLLHEVIHVHIQRGESDGCQEISFVDMLLSLRNDATINVELTTDRIKGLIGDAFAAGIDTTYITLDWAMSELLKNPKEMKKLQEEVRGIIKHNNIVTSEDLAKMDYLRAVIKETLRLHPPLPLLLPRESMEECEINGFTIPKGTKVIINAWAIGREAKSWEAAEEFMPERFINSQVEYKGNSSHLIPFGAGRRICPGIAFATTTSELVLANLVHNFDWELPEGMTIDEFDMSESPGMSVHRKDSLRLVVKHILASN
ncbi:Cytochrome P450 [Rhynchospora pubera]|uniref:Cytochrome P450 n=1 Tax=Rhynchospora pubera TaxID=906938 RepID=A0AAV8CGF5_9POAL|nr:Cytochrome P450 [Rhynchospora pubera]